MTRWARVQSTHRTRKQPEEATSWQEFQSQKKQLDTGPNTLTKSQIVQKGIHREPDKRRKITDEERRKLKKEKLLAKMRETREQKGMVLLPEKIERKIYRVKKAMRSKGKSEEEIKQEIRQLRRKEELVFRKLCAKACLQCRQPGHKVADCPKSLRVGICYKCGAVDHTSSKCLRARGSSFDFATCFVCGGEGHISRECLKNEKGIFPKGGGCRFCGSNKHKKQECPERKAVKQNVSHDEEVVAEVLLNAKESADKEDHLKVYDEPSSTPTTIGSPFLTTSTAPTRCRKAKVVNFL